MSDWSVGATAEVSVYVVHSEYKDVVDIDGSIVNIEMPYDKPRYATELLPGERGNLLIAAGDVVSDEVAAALAG